jgi:hypothetical protein
MPDAPQSQETGIDRLDSLIPSADQALENERSLVRACVFFRFVGEHLVGLAV